MKPEIVVGIDTGVSTGIAVWNVSTRCFNQVETTKIHIAMSAVEELHLNNPGKVLVRVEDARQRTWYDSSHKSREEERKKLQGVGSVKRDAVIWEDFLSDLGVAFQMVHPKNNTTKLSAEAFKGLTKWKKRTSEHSRDAAMLAYGY
jgi:hypothetical protein